MLFLQRFEADRKDKSDVGKTGIILFKLLLYVSTTGGKIYNFIVLIQVNIKKHWQRDLPIGSIFFKRTQKFYAPDYWYIKQDDDLDLEIYPSAKKQRNETRQFHLELTNPVSLVTTIKGTEEFIHMDFIVVTKNQIDMISIDTDHSQRLSLLRDLDILATLGRSGGSKREQINVFHSV